jgi:hypothetical protein
MLEQKKMKFVKQIEASQRRLLEDMLFTTTKKQLKSEDKSSKEPKKSATAETSISFGNKFCTKYLAPFTEEEMLYFSINCETHTSKEILNVFPRLKPMYVTLDISRY